MPLIQEGKTPLHIVAEHGFITCLSIILGTKGIDVNHQDKVCMCVCVSEHLHTFMCTYVGAVFKEVCSFIISSIIVLNLKSTIATVKIKQHSFLTKLVAVQQGNAALVLGLLV